MKKSQAPQAPQARPHSTIILYHLTPHHHPPHPPQPLQPSFSLKSPYTTLFHMFYPGFYPALFPSHFFHHYIASNTNNTLTYILIDPLKRKQQKQENHHRLVPTSPSRISFSLLMHDAAPCTFYLRILIYSALFPRSGTSRARFLALRA
jgi:hypothetical protein